MPPPPRCGSWWRGLDLLVTVLIAVFGFLFANTN